MVLLLAASCVQAASTANFTIESPMRICVRENSTYSCEGDASLRLSGTEDHMLDFVPQPLVGPDGDNTKIVSDFIRNVPNALVESLPLFFVFVALAAAFAYGMLRVFGGKH